MRQPMKLPSDTLDSSKLEFSVVSKIEVSFKYWSSGSECLSDWQQAQLKFLRKFVDKIQNLTPTEIQTDQGLCYKLHKGKTSSGFSRPAAVSKDIALAEMRISGKSRVHGFVESGRFYLVWLDRNHAVFPSGK
ncbi:MAG6450 family protein [Methylocapsa palsarum]|uniref:Uncharacterized protein n=1 Tax=Methylocapsa palsarum TaxID=1612308 RepID=A0A1I3Z5Y0_9HYPH|nr:hypothetical protein SAMN05444581_10792 [Methylocapsa palsarum]